MGHSPSGVHQKSSSSAGRGRGVGFGRGQGSTGRGQQRVQFRVNPMHEPQLGVPTPNIAAAPGPEAVPRPNFQPEIPSLDDLQADPQAADLLRQAMATLHRNREQHDRGVVTVSEFRRVFSQK